MSVVSIIIFVISIRVLCSFIPLQETPDQGWDHFFLND